MIIRAFFKDLPVEGPITKRDLMKTCAGRWGEWGGGSGGPRVDFLQLQCYILLHFPTKGTFTGGGDKALHWGGGNIGAGGEGFCPPPVYMLKKALA